MGLLNFRIAEVKRAIEHKCGIQLEGDGEWKGWHIHGGRKEFRVQLPHHLAELKKGTAKRVASQLKLTNEQFKALVECPMKADEYQAHVAKLRDLGSL